MPHHNFDEWEDGVVGHSEYAVGAHRDLCAVFWHGGGLVGHDFAVSPK